MVAVVSEPTAGRASSRLVESGASPTPHDARRRGRSTVPDIAVKLGHAALRPARAAARSGRSALADEAERAIDALLAGPLPEAVARSIVRHQVVDRVIAEVLDAPDGDRAPVELAVQRVLESPALERCITDAVESTAVKTSVERIVDSPAFRGAMLEVLSSPEIRQALARQTAGFGSELAASLRVRTRALDDSVEAKVHRRAAESHEFGGLVSRGGGFVVDLVLAHLGFLVAAASAAVVASLVGTLRPTPLAQSLAGGGWLLIVAAYFTGFWATAGQTPGMRLEGLRVMTGAGACPGFLRSLLRFAGLVVAVIPFFAGFLPILFDGRRRALQDFVAGTVVVDDSPADDASL